MAGGFRQDEPRRIRRVDRERSSSREPRLPDQGSDRVKKLQHPSGRFRSCNISAVRDWMSRMRGLSGRIGGGRPSRSARAPTRNRPRGGLLVERRRFLASARAAQAGGASGRADGTGRFSPGGAQSGRAARSRGDGSTCRPGTTEVTTPLGRARSRVLAGCRRNRSDPAGRSGDGRRDHRAACRRPRSGTSACFATRPRFGPWSITTSSRPAPGDGGPAGRPDARHRAARRSAPARSSRRPACRAQAASH